MLLGFAVIVVGSCVALFVNDYALWSGAELAELDRHHVDPVTEVQRARTAA